MYKVFYYTSYGRYYKDNFYDLFSCFLFAIEHLKFLIFTYLLHFLLSICIFVVSLIIPWIPNFSQVT